VTFSDVVARLVSELRRELPGPEAQARLAPIPRRDWPAGFHQARIRHAAGLLLVFPKPDTTIDAAAFAPKHDGTDIERRREHAESAESEQNNALRVPRFRRWRSSEKEDPLRALRSLRSTSSDRPHIVLTVRADALRHGGQVSLPGGVVEPGETFEQAALREAHEEVALPLAPVRVLGALTPLDIPVSGFRLHPIVAVTETEPALTPADAEVANILEVAVDELLDPANLVRTRRERDGVTYVVPAFRICGHEIWGATAMVLAEFLALLGACPGKSQEDTLP
jgi:8-oxo-dGTP pyrophosphatase MutT (NUDIX family)